LTHHNLQGVQRDFSVYLSKDFHVCRTYTSHRKTLKVKFIVKITKFSFTSIVAFILIISGLMISQVLIFW